MRRSTAGPAGIGAGRNPQSITSHPETTMPDLHLIISQPEPGEWYGRLDVTEALEAAGWESDETRTVLRHPSGALWALTNESEDSGLDCPNGAVIEFPGSTPTVVIVAAFLAAAA